MPLHMIHCNPTYKYNNWNPQITNIIITFLITNALAKSISSHGCSSYPVHQPKMEALLFRREIHWHQIFRQKLAWNGELEQFGSRWFVSNNRFYHEPTDHQKLLRQLLLTQMQMQKQTSVKTYKDKDKDYKQKTYKDMQIYLTNQLQLANGSKASGQDVGCSQFYAAPASFSFWELVYALDHFFLSIRTLVSLLRTLFWGLQVFSRKLWGDAEHVGNAWYLQFNDHKM